jgi:hypothetical protein
LLVATVDSLQDGHVSTITATFVLVALARLALAEGNVLDASTALGAVDGLRRRAGLLAWPLTRRSEADLVARVAGAAEPGIVEQGRAIGGTLTHRDALAFVLTVAGRG